MALASTENPEVAPPSKVKDRVVDAYRHGAHLSHEVRLARSVAADAIEEGIHAARRAAVRSVRRGVERLEDFKEEATHRIKRAPLASVTLLGSGALLFGAAIGYVCGRCSARGENSTARVEADHD